MHFVVVCDAVAPIPVKLILEVSRLTDEEIHAGARVTVNSGAGPAYAHLQGIHVRAATRMERSAIIFLFVEIGGIAFRIGTGWSTRKACSRHPADPAATRVRVGIQR